jgi:hypothetical protein
MVKVAKLAILGEFACEGWEILDLVMDLLFHRF